MKAKRRSSTFSATALALGLVLCSAASCGGGENANARATSENGETKAGDQQDTGSLTTLATYDTGDVEAGPMQVHGELPAAAKLDGRYVYLFETEGKDIFKVDSALISEGKYTFDRENAELGLYQFGMSSLRNSVSEMIIDPREKELQIVHRSATFKGGLSFGESEQNEALMRYRRSEKKHEQALSKVRKSQVSRADKLKQIQALDASFKTTQDSLAALYPDSYFANVVAHLQSPFRLNKAKYWSDLDFTDASLIHSTVYTDRIEDYMRTHASKENTKENKHKGFYNAVDQIAAIVQAGGNDRVLEFMLYTISEGFYKSNLEEVSHYVIDNYFYGDACGDSEISELFKMKAAGIRNLKLGNTPPDFILPDDKGGMIKSKEVVADNELTLIIFWASFCHKCEEEIPILASLHKQYAPKGFEVIGISVDLDDRSWKGGISSKGAPGYNVSDLQGWAGPVTKEYRVTSTPVMFLVDKKGELVLKPKRVSELEQYLAKKLI